MAHAMCTPNARVSLLGCIMIYDFGRDPRQFAMSSSLTTLQFRVSVNVVNGGTGRRRMTRKTFLKS